jgi:hypothetical protein
LAGPASALAGDPGPELQDDFDGVADFDAVLGAAQEAFAARYGGAFIDRSVDPPVLRVTVVSPTSADAETLAQITGSNSRVQLGPADRSLDDLERAASAIEAELQRALGAQEWSVGVDEESHKIDVSTTQLSDVLRIRIDALAPADAIRFDIAEGNGFSPQAACRNCYPPYEAGLVARTLKIDTSDLITCTSGFAVHRNGNNYGTTAGHCGPTGTPVIMGNKSSAESGSTRTTAAGSAIRT